MTGGRAWLLAGTALLTVALNLASLETYPPPHCDETHYAGSPVPDRWMRGEESEADRRECATEGTAAALAVPRCSPPA